MERLQTALTETEDLLGATRAWIRENYYKGGKPQEVPLELGLFSARELKTGPHIVLKAVADFVETVDAGMQDPYRWWVNSREFLALLIADVVIISGFSTPKRLIPGNSLFMLW